MWLTSFPWTPEALGEINTGRRLKLWVLASRNALPVGRIEAPIESYVDYLVHGVADPLIALALAKVGPASHRHEGLHFYSGSIPLDQLSDDVRTHMTLAALPHLGPGGSGTDTTANLWFGRPQGSVGLHWDGRLGYVMQLHGSKSVILLEPEQRQWLYPEPYWNGPNSRVNPTAVDLERFPRARHAEGSTGMLEPGDVLVIPAGWWHHLTATTDVATSINLWLTLIESPRDTRATVTR